MFEAHALRFKFTQHNKHCKKDMISWLYLLATLTVSCMLAAGDTEGIDVNNQGRKIGEITPEVAMDFKVIVNSYEQECYYLKLTTNDIFHFIINVSFSI